MLKSMDFSSILSFVFLINYGITSAAHEKFGFPFKTYVDSLKETHVGPATHIFLKATGCHGHKAVHKIKEENTAFVIEPQSGHLLIEKLFDYDEKKSYTFTVVASANHGKCYAELPVTIDIINVNKHRPQFVFEFDGKHETEGRVKCEIDEETKVVEMHPQIFVKDEDTGPAGLIHSVSIRESVAPFIASMNNETGELLLAGDPYIDFDIERMSKYSFSLEAKDSGSMPVQRTSKPLYLTCDVVAKDNFPPVFVENNYVGRVVVGEAKKNVAKVEAIDKDKNAKFGIICDYFIHKDSDVPFTISNKGVVSLEKPLGKNAKDTYVFIVFARDCGGLETEDGAMITVIVDRPCKTEYENIEKTHKVEGCGGLLQLLPGISLNECGRSHKYAEYKSTIKMETTAILKGCDRETYKASGVFKMCNVNKTFDLLPSPEQGKQWTEPLTTNKDKRSENIYEFDGKTALDIPSNIHSYGSEDLMTISTWIWTKQLLKKQYILATTDRQRLNRKHFALYTKGNQLIFIHRQEASSNSGVCPFRFRWTPDIFDVSWHHLVITIAGCNHAQLYVDGKKMPSATKELHWPLHSSKMQTRFVVGAQWFGREQKYGDYFNGYLSGLSVNFGETVTPEAINCVFECKEKIKIASAIPNGFKVEQHGHDEITIRGKGSAASFENLLRGLYYLNTRTHPTVGHRPIQIHTKIDTVVLPMISMNIMVESPNGDQKLELSGAEKKMTSVKELNKYGIPIASKLVITADKCLPYLTEAHVEIRPPLNTDESLINPGLLLTMYNLQKEEVKNGEGLIIHGLATKEHYQRILRDLVFVNLAPKTGIRHTFKITVSNKNKDSVSNILETQVTIADIVKVPDMLTIDRELKNALPGAIRDIEKPEKKEQKGIGFGFLIGLIVSCACLFVFIILVVIVRFRRDETTNETSVEEKEKEPVVNVTMNPLEKFEDVKTEEKPAVKEAKPDKMNLEWDDAYIA